MSTTIEPLAPDDIDLAFVARPITGLEIVDLDGDQVLIGGNAQLLALNSTATLVFQFLDGEASLAELVDDFAEVLGVDRTIVETDVLTFVRDLGVRGLLEGVALPAPDLPDWMDYEPPTRVEPGDELDDFVLTDLDGVERSLSEFRGRRTLLVNWSPGCGFCVKIAAELAALDALLAEHDVQLVFVTSGDAESNDALHEQYGLAAPTLLREGTDVDPFRGTGTPAAYLLDADGTLAEAMVVGADQVPVLARDLAGVDPATPYGVGVDVADDDAPVVSDDDVDGAEVRGKYLPAPGAMCGPGGGGGASNSTDWQGTRAYALGEYHVGLRYDDAETAAVLDRLFPDARVNDRRAPDNYSVALGGTRTTKGAGTSRSLKLLVHGGTQLVRSRSGGRVLAALLQYLSADLESADPSLTRVNATAMVRDGEAVLLPPGLVDYVKQLQPRLAKSRLCIVDSPRTLVDFAAGELVVTEPAIPHDRAVVDELDDGVKLGNELPWIRPGRYPLHTWFLAPGEEHRGLLRPAVAVVAALPLLSDVEDLRGAVERLGAAFADITPHGLWYGNADELVDQVSAAF